MYTYKLAGSMKIEIQPFKRKIHKMVKHVGLIIWYGLHLKGLIKEFSKVFIWKGDVTF